jgi:protein TonB
MPKKARSFPRNRAPVRAPGVWPYDPARDRLSSTLFLAALLHGTLILGVTFTAEPHSREPTPNSLDVVIVTRDYAPRAPPRNPALLAQQNLVGRGNAPLDARLATAVPQTPLPAAPGQDQAGVLAEPLRPGTPEPGEQRVAALVPGRATVLQRETGAPQPPARRKLFDGAAEASELLAEPDAATVIPDANPRELMVSANTRESRIAGYLNTWKTRVERIGTLNFPNAARLASIRTYPVLEVAITADGGLKEVVVRNSSGYRNLDQAAMEILRIAAPFEPFPERLRDDYDVLRFAYEWHFGAGLGTGRVTAVNGT